MQKGLPPRDSPQRFDYCDCTLSRNPMQTHSWHNAWSKAPFSSHHRAFRLLVMLIAPLQAGQWWSPYIPDGVSLPEGKEETATLLECKLFLWDLKGQWVCPKGVGERQRLFAAICIQDMVKELSSTLATWMGISSCLQSPFVLHCPSDCTFNSTRIKQGSNSTLKYWILSNGNFK